MSQQPDPPLHRFDATQHGDTESPPPRVYTADDFLSPMWRGNPSAGERWWLLWRAFCTEPDDEQRLELSKALDSVQAEIDGLGKAAGRP